MQVTRGEVTETERCAFDEVVRHGGRQPEEFRLEVFTVATAARMRAVHVMSDHGSAQYDACQGRCWTQSFAKHLAQGRFH